MKKNKLQSKLDPSAAENTEEVFLAEALGHAAARDVTFAGKIILSQGSLVDPRTIGSLAVLGIDRIFVYRKPRISIIIIGDGLMDPGTAPMPGKAYDFGSATLKAALEMMRIRPVFLRRLPDKPKTLGRVISFALNQSDMVLLMVKEARQGIQGIREFLGDVRIQFFSPGKDLDLEGKKIVMDKNKKPVFCLPYNSDQVFEYFEKFVQPAIWMSMGLKILGITAHVA